MSDEYAVTELQRTWEQLWRARRNFLKACRRYCDLHNEEPEGVLPPELKKASTPEGQEKI